MEEGEGGKQVCFYLGLSRIRREHSQPFSTVYILVLAEHHVLSHALKEIGETAVIVQSLDMSRVRPNSHVYWPAARLTASCEKNSYLPISQCWC